LDESGVGTSTVYTDFENASVILNILFHKPEDFERVCKPAAIRENTTFVLNSNKITVNSTKADDNGAYLYKGTSRRLFFWNKEEEARSVHKLEEEYYFKDRIGSNKYKDVIVRPKDVYEVKRSYRQNKSNPWLSQCISEVRNMNDKKYHSYYLVVYKVAGNETPGDFIMERRGNASHPHTPIYYRQDPTIVDKIDEKIKSGQYTDKIYVDLLDDKDTLSETIKNPRIIENRKARNKEQKDVGIKQKSE